LNGIDKYKQVLLNANYFSKLFLSELNNSLDGKIKYYSENVVEEVPDGFDYDLIFNTQEMGSLLSELEHFRVIAVGRTEVGTFVILDGYQLIEFHLILEDDNWRISEIVS
jgi:hypothetical protein